LYWPRWFA